METVNPRRSDSWLSFPARRSVLRSETIPASNTNMSGNHCNVVPTSCTFIAKYNLASSGTSMLECDCNVIPASNASMLECDCNVIPKSETSMLECDCIVIPKSETSMLDCDCNVIPKSGTLLIEYDRANIFFNSPSHFPEGHSVGNKEVTNSENTKETEPRGRRHKEMKREAASLCIVFVLTFEGKSADDVRRIQGKSANDVRSIQGNSADVRSLLQEKSADEVRSTRGKSADDVRSIQGNSADVRSLLHGKSADVRSLQGKSADEVKSFQGKSADVGRLQEKSADGRSFQGKSDDVGSFQRSMVLVIITLVCEAVSRLLTQQNYETRGLFKSDYGSKRRTTVHPRGRKHETVCHSHEDRTMKPVHEYWRHSVSTERSVSDKVANTPVVSLKRNLKATISILQKINKRSSFGSNSSVAGDSLAVDVSSCRVEQSHNDNRDNDDENDVPRRSCLLDISHYQVEHDHNNNKNNNGDDEYDDDVTRGSCRLEIFHCHVEQSCYDNKDDNDDEYVVAGKSCLLDTSHRKEQGQNDNNNSGYVEDDYAGIIGCFSERSRKSGAETNGYIETDDLEYPTVLNASARMYDLSSASGRNIRKPHENRPICTSSSSKSNISDDENHANLVYDTHNTDNSQNTHDSSVFNEDCFSRIMTNAGLSDDDLNKLLESETALDCVLFGSQIFGDLLGDECVLTTSSEDTFIDIDNTLQCGSEVSDASIFQSELTEQLPTCYNSHISNTTGLATPVYAGCSYVASTYYPIISMPDDCDYLSLTGSTENTYEEISWCTSRLIDSSNADFPRKQSTSTVVSYEDSQLLEYNTPVACVHATVGSDTCNICGFTTNENNPNQCMTETMAYLRDENETSADSLHEVYGQTSRVIGNLQSQSQPTVSVPLMNYSDNLPVATSNGGHLSEGGLGTESESANMQQEVSTDGDESVAFILQPALPFDLLTQSNTKRKLTRFTSSSMLSSGMVRKKLDIVSNSAEDEVLEPVAKRRCSSGRLEMAEAGK